MIDKWHIIISGFKQNRLIPNGMEKLWMKLRPYSSPTTCIQYLEWDADWKAQASFIKRNSQPGAKVYVYAYSWGAGWGFKNLARQLEKLNIGIQVAVLCDPVDRTLFLPSWIPLNPLSLRREGSIKLPSNIREIHWLFQRENTPCGHTPICESADIHLPKQLNLIHSEMEDSPVFHDMVLRVVCGE